MVRMNKDLPLKCVKMLMRKIHGGFNQVGSEASSDEEEEETEDEEDDDEDQQPAPASVINVSICNRRHNAMNYFVCYWIQEP